MTVKDLNKLMWGNFAQMQQNLMVGMMQSLNTIVPIIVQNNIKELVKDIKEVKTEQVSVKGEIEALKQENDELKATMAEHQRFLASLDNERRSKNIIITGVAEDKPLNTNKGSARNDEEKVAMLFEEIGVNLVNTTKIERLGKPSDTNKKRPIKVILCDPDDRRMVLDSAKKLKESVNVDCKTVYIKKDQNPIVRREMARLREVLKREKAKPENVGKSVTLNYKERKVMVNDVEVDRLRSQAF
jgi:FtsZ-binding cell division protein ZapB